MRLLLLASMLTLTACSNPVPSFIVAPQVFWNQTNQLSSVAFSLNVQDNRPTNGTLVMRDGDKVNAYPTSNDLPQQLQQSTGVGIYQSGRPCCLKLSLWWSQCRLIN